jgi:hypothetical protein
MNVALRLPLAAIVFACLTPLAFATATCGFDSTLNVSEQTATGATNGLTFGDVCVNLDTSTTATITFTAASGYTLVDGNIADIQVNASSFSEAFVSDTTSSSPTADSKNVNGYGTFNLTWQNGAASDHEGFFTFTVTNTSGTWASAGDVLTNNGSGFDAAAHVLCLAGSGCETAGDMGGPLTFFVAEGAAVPEPRFYALLLVGLMAAIGVMFRRRQQVDS